MSDVGVAAKLRAAFELSPTILAVTSLEDGRLLEVNDAFLRATGYTRDEVVGRPIPEIGLWVDPGLRDEGLAGLRQGRPVRDMEARFRTKSGEELVAIANADVVVVDGRSCVLTALMDITARVRAEAALRETERRFSQAFHANPLPMSITSLHDGRHLDVNEAALRHSGYTRDEMLGRTKPELGFWVAAGERERLMALLNAEGRVRDFEVTFRTRTGEHRDLLVNSEVVRYAGEPAVLSVSLDITDRKRAEAQQRDAEQRSRFLAEASRILTSTLDYESTLDTVARLAVSAIADWCAVHLREPAGDIRCVAVAHADASSERLGHEVMARHPPQSDSPFGVPAVLRSGRSLLRRDVPDSLLAAIARTPAELAELRRFGLRSVIIVPLTARGRVLGTLTFATAASERRYDESDLRLAEDLAARAALAVDNSRLYADAEDRRREAEVVADLARRINASLDADTVLPAVADAARALTGCDVARIALWDETRTTLVYRYSVGARSDHAGLRLLAGRGLIGEMVAAAAPRRTDDILADPRLQDNVRPFAEAEGSVSVMTVPIMRRERVEGFIYCGRRQRRPFSDRDEAVAVRVAEHAAIALGNADLFAREQRARAEAEAANRGKDDFLAVLSHELRTPLQAMLGWLRLMRGGHLDAATAAKALATVERNTQTQMKIIADLLDVSGILAGKLRVDVVAMDLVAAVEAAVQSVRATAEAKGLSVSSEAKDGPLFVNGDPSRIDQVLSNLLSNAVKFTAAGGTIDVRLQRHGGHARLIVADTGIGIAPELLPHVFDRFRQADSSSTRMHGGLGLGLALVRHLVEAHGGTVEAASRGLGEGATFVIDIPLRDAAVASPSGTADARPTLPRGAHIMVIDDDADTRDVLAYALRTAGMVVTAAASSEEALALLACESCDAVVSDLSMPTEDGYTFVRRLRQLDGGRSRRRVAVALTAHAGTDDRGRALDAGFDAYLVKPVDGNEIVALLARLLYT